MELTPGEHRVIMRLREMKADQNGHGYGIIRVEINDGRETRVRREFEEVVR